jgi:hypothetical protein
MKYDSSVFIAGGGVGEGADEEENTGREGGEGEGEREGVEEEESSWEIEFSSVDPADVTRRSYRFWML